MRRDTGGALGGAVAAQPIGRSVICRQQPISRVCQLPGKQGRGV
jgi:hypothetical protein